ncbi:hypothetical protein Bhyg_00492 [Pseudolycoriella hygida]|uniref:DUF4789 domain-containing protein n=1 Tax=Pseudolycoriella hygida TaxID=35572 RepID=A0A9Q0N7N3_9DIPT|nr:hypothetical protein Bhyg_00492 [Pseudolycoriella hygida]
MYINIHTIDEMKLKSFSATFLLIYISRVDFVSGQGRQRTRTRTVTTTTPEPLSELDQTIADREVALHKREENLREREENFRSREVTLAVREAAFREREEKLSVREENLAIREQNALKGSCSDKLEETTPPPDYTLVRYDEATQKYLEIGSTKYCSENMRFFADPDNETAGTCDCDYHECSRPLLYSDKYKQCFWAWSQGPCEQEEWYTYDDEYNPVCEKNPCPPSEALPISNYYFRSDENGKCYKTGSKGYCSKKNERLLTAPGAPIPTCRSQTICYPLTIPATQECVPGNKRHYDKLCNVE